MDSFHKMIILGISASVGLTVFVFNIVLGLSDDVTAVREDVAYIKGTLDAYWAEAEDIKAQP